jgi:hypothetical protein
MRSILTIGAIVLSVSMMGQTSISSRSDQGKAASRDGASSSAARAAAGLVDESKMRMQRIAEAYTDVLYLSKKEEAAIIDRLNSMGPDMERALAQLAKAQAHVDELIAAELKKYESTLDKEQLRVLERARSTGEWECLVDPCKCTLQPINKRAQRPGVDRARPDGVGAPSTTTPRERDSRASPEKQPARR